MGTSLLGKIIRPPRPSPEVVNRAPVDLRTSRLGFAAPTSVPPTMTTALGVMEWASTVFPIVDRLASSQAAITWRLYRTDGTGDDDREEVATHPALSVWHRPNDFYTQDELVETAGQHYELTGEMWFLVGRSALLGGNGPPLELWPVRPDKMRPVAHPTEFISGYVYTGGGMQVPLRVQDVIYARRPRPTDPYRGLSPILSLLLDLSGERAAAEYNEVFFRNGAAPSGLIEVEEHLQDPEFQQLRERWNEQHGGLANAHRVAIMDNTAKWKDVRYTRKDMEFVELRNFSAEKVRKAFGYPKFLLGDVDDVNRASAEASAVLFADWLVKPRAEKLKRTLNARLLPMFGPMGQGVAFDFDDPTPPDRAAELAEQESKVTRAIALINAGFDPGEVLELVGLPPLTMAERPQPPPAAPDPGGAFAGADGATAAALAAMGRHLALAGNGNSHSTNGQHGW